MTSNNNSEEKFWTDDFCSLFKQPWRIVPLASYTRDEKLNALTRLSILIALVLLVLGHEYWYIFLGLSLLILILLKYTCNGSKIEGFSITPTYASNDLHQTTLAPAFSESWRSPPPSYDVYTNVPVEDPSTRYTRDPLLLDGDFSPKSWPYGTYQSPMNLMLPQDQAMLQNRCSTSTTTAREYVNSAFLKNRIGFSENMTRIYKQKLNKRFRNASQAGSTFSPFHSF